jgi:hypothetical protein
MPKPPPERCWPKGRGGHQTRRRADRGRSNPAVGQAHSGHQGEEQPPTRCVPWWVTAAEPLRAQLHSGGLPNKIIDACARLRLDFDDLHARSSREHLVTCSFRPLCPLSRVRPRRLDSQRSRTSCGDRRSVGVSMSLCLGGLTASDLVPTVTWYLLSWCCSTDPTASSRDNTARHSILWLDGVERSARGCRDDDCSTGPDLEWTSNFFVGSGVAP